MFAQRLKELRTQKSLTQVTFADLLKVSAGTVAMWETGKRTPDVYTLKQIADYFKVTVDSLIGDTVLLNFYPSEYDDCIIKCPVCGYECSHFTRVLSVSFESTKSSGIAIEFDCEAEHKFYIVIETYKGFSYLTIAGQNDVFLTNENIEKKAQKKLIYKNKHPDTLFAIKKYRTLDGYGKKAVNLVLETEYERCAEITSTDKIITLPKAELKASAGTGQWLGDDEYKTWIHVVDTPEARKSNVVIEIDGDSMEPIFHDGDMVLVKLQPSIDIGDIGIFIVDNCGFIKKLGFNELISINELYDNIPLHEFENVKCVGKVLGKAIVR